MAVTTTLALTTGCDKRGATMRADQAGAVEATDTEAPPTSPAAGAPGRESVGMEQDAATQRAMAALESSRPTFEVPEAVRNALEQGRWEDALRALEATDQVEAIPQLAFARGWAAHQAGRHTEALATLEPLVERLDLLANDARWAAARSALELGQLDRAEALAAAVPKGSIYADEALLLRGKARLRGESTEAKADGVALLERYLEEHGGRSGGVHETRWLLIDHLLAQGNLEAASEHLARLEVDFPAAARAKEASRRLAEIAPRLPAARRKELERSATARLLARTDRLYEQHRSQEVIEELSPRVDAWKEGSDVRCQALYLVAQSHTKLRKHDDSAIWYRRLLRECPSFGERRRTLYKLGRGLWNVNRRKEAREVFAQVLEEYPEHSYADDVMHFTGRSLLEEGKDEEAIGWFKRQTARYPQGDMAADAHWYVVRDYQKKKDWAGLVAYVEGVSDPNEDSLYTAGRLGYYRARALGRLGKEEEARQQYRATLQAHTLGFYALLSAHQLAMMQPGVGAEALTRVENLCRLEGFVLCQELAGGGDVALPEITIPQDVRQERAFRRGVLLLHLGLPGLAEGDFRRLAGKLSGDESKLWALALLLHAANAHHLSHDIPRRRIERWQQSYPGAGRGELTWQIAYPRPYLELVRRWAQERKLPESLVYALMREESGFNPRIESWANARGLLQLMVPTAETAARRSGWDRAIEPQDLFEPELNIRLGTAYQDQLAERFARHPALIIAGYNAGGHRIQEWLERQGDLPLDVWIEMIPYSQTRNYTKRVLTSLWTYAWLYGGEGGTIPTLSWDLPEPKETSDKGD